MRKGAEILSELFPPVDRQAFRQTLATTRATLPLRLAVVLVWALSVAIAGAPEFAIVWACVLSISMFARLPWERRTRDRLNVGEALGSAPALFLASAVFNNALWSAAPIWLWFMDAPAANILAAMLLFGLLVFVSVQWVGAIGAALVSAVPYFATSVLFVATMPDPFGQATLATGTVTMFIARMIMANSVNIQHKKLAAANADYEHAIAQAEHLLTAKREATEALLGPMQTDIAPDCDRRDRLNRLIGEIDARNDALLCAADALNTARAAAEKASAAKSQFLANMSHELRTPLNAIIGYADLIIDTAPKGGAADDAAAIRRASDHLLWLINELLDMAKIEAGAMRLTMRAFDAQSLLEEAVETIRPLALANGNRVNVTISPGLRSWTNDPLRIKQCALNLLSNAAKFTENGVITLTAAPIGDGEARRLRITISDTGCGISAKDLQKVWAPFEQADGASTRKHGGTGLGLPITRQLAESMGGGVSVRSVLGEGSTFVLEVADWPAKKDRSFIMSREDDARAA
jgi:signal transduction histidine kinase